MHAELPVHLGEVPEDVHLVHGPSYIGRTEHVVQLHRVVGRGVVQVVRVDLKHQHTHPVMLMFKIILLLLITGESTSLYKFTFNC